MGVNWNSTEDIMEGLHKELETVCEMFGVELIEVEVPVKKWYQFWK